MALQLAHGSWILLGSMPWAGTCDGGRINSGGNIWGNWHVGQTNSVTPGPTVNIIRQPAHRTWQPPVTAELRKAGGPGRGGGGGASGREGETGG